MDYLAGMARLHVFGRVLPQMGLVTWTTHTPTSRAGLGYFHPA